VTTVSFILIIRAKS